MAIYQFSMIPLEEETHYITNHKDRMVAPPCSQNQYARALFIMRNFNDVFTKLRSGKYLFSQANRDYVEKHRMRHRSIQIYEVYQEVPVSVLDCERQLEELQGRLLEIGDIDFILRVMNFVAPAEEDYLGRYWYFQRVAEEQNVESADDEDEDSTDIEEDENDEVVEESKVETFEEEKEETVEEAFENVGNMIFEKREAFTHGEYVRLNDSLKVIFKNQSAVGSGMPEVLTHRNSRFSSGHNIIVNDGEGGGYTILTNCPDPRDGDGMNAEWTEQFPFWRRIGSVFFLDFAEAVADGDIYGQEEDEEPEIVVDEDDEDEDSTDDEYEGSQRAQVLNNYEDEDSTDFEEDEEDEEEQFRCLRCGRNWSNPECIECEVRGLRGVFIFIRR